MTDPDCIFCKIGAGEIPTNKVYEDEMCIAFRDMEPLMPTHVLIIPKDHYRDIADDVPVTINDKIITLSTCTSKDNERYLVQAVRTYDSYEQE